MMEPESTAFLSMELARPLAEANRELPFYPSQVVYRNKAIHARNNRFFAPLFIDSGVALCYYGFSDTKSVVWKECYMMQGSLPTRLRVLRAERGLTLREAASLADVRPGTLSELERGVRHPHDITLSRIAKGYGVPVEELLEEPVLAGKA